jgi:hypothetical protein
MYKNKIAAGRNVYLAQDVMSITKRPLEPGMLCNFGDQT